MTSTEQETKTEAAKATETGPAGETAPQPAKTAKPKTAPKAKAAPAPRKPKTVRLSIGTVEVPDLTAWAEKAPTPVVLDYLKWLSAATGIEFTDAMTQAAYLCQSPLRQRYQQLVKPINPHAR